MKNKFLLIFCSAALLTVMNTSYASSLSSTSKGFPQIDRRIARGGQLCRGKFSSTYTNYTAEYINYVNKDKPFLRIRYEIPLEDYLGSQIKMISINGRSILIGDNFYFSAKTIKLDAYRFKGSSREYTLKGGEKFKAVTFYRRGERAGKTDAFECTIPAKPEGYDE